MCVGFNRIHSHTTRTDSFIIVQWRGIRDCLLVRGLEVMTPLTCKRVVTFEVC